MTHTCTICKEKIIETKEKWVRLTDFHKKQQTGEVFYHLECWRDRFKLSNSIRKQKMYKQAMESIGTLLQTAKNMNSDEGNEDGNVYELKQNR
jgi:hypothetical protein